MRGWRLEAAGAEVTPRLLVMADAATPLMEWQRLCDGGKYAPPVLDDGEAATLARLPSDEDAPLWARGNLPAAVLPLADRKSTRLNSSNLCASRMPTSD